ncbi:HEAT repeat domain-containing protein [Thaumasiovibrio subtropicus]|uniref:HEAT repeat domain-containing protein n=1 Tax=Thaumasiovibrio subtropicus TaxID=1891207 RepID=UPI000B34EEBF|nr:HEAT repeat domain-containing protein [Thaumasiovibrio subtropicus]
MTKQAKSSAEIVAAARAELDEDKYWALIAELHQRGSDIEFDLASRLLESAEPQARRIGADILGQLGWSTKRFQTESVQRLIDVLSDTDDKVVASAAFALGHRQVEKAVKHLIQHVDHPNSYVRHGVVLGLSHSQSATASKALIKLSQDSNTEVKSWATFALATQSNVDSIAVREALLANTIDDDPEVCGEAMIGLAKRKDPRVKKVISKALCGPFYGDWAVEAAALFADTAFVPLLEQLYEREAEQIEPRFLEHITDAINLCRVPQKP